MDPALVSLLAASLAFVGTHFAMSHPLRAPIVRLLGTGGFMGVYSIVSLACMVWMARAFSAAPPGGTGGMGALGQVLWAGSSILTIPALVLFLGSVRANPALPAPGAEEAARAEPAGVFRVTRHPMMWGFALWAAAHLLLFWSERTTIVAIAILVLALLGAHLQERKKRALMGEDWTSWEAKTSYWPRWWRLGSAGPVLWGVAIVAWLAITWAHQPIGYIPAGIWRWV